MRKYRFIGVAASAICLLGVAGCATETSQALAVPQVVAASSSYAGYRAPVSIGKFDNRSSFMRGIFTDGVDRLGSQAKTVLISHLQQSRHFTVMERENFTEMDQEARLRGELVRPKAADFVVTGDVTEFGRKETGDQQLFGILGRGKSQVAYAKVTINVVDARTSEVVFSSAGAGEYALSNREIIGFGGTASYDSTLNGKVLDLAIREAVDRLVAAADAGQWKVQR